MNSLNSFQKKATLESLFCPPLDSALIAVISNDYDDINECYEVLDSLAKEANPVLDSERVCESEIFSENANNNYKSGSSCSSEPSSDKGDGSITSLEFLMDGLSFSEGYDSESICLTNDEILLDEEIEQYNYNLFEDQHSTIETPTEFLKSCFPMLSETKIKSLFQENNNDTEIVLNVILNEVEREKELTQPYAPSPSSSSYLTLKSDENDHNSLITESRTKHHLSHNNSSSPEVNYEYDDASLVAANGSLENAINLLLDPEEFNMARPNQSNKSSQIQQRTILPKKMELNIKAETDKTDEFQVVTRPKKNQKKISSNFASITSIPTITKNSPATTRFYNLEDVSSEDDEEYEEYDPQYCRQMAQDYKIRRNEAFKNAFNAFKKSKSSRNGDGGISFHYSTEGQKFDAEMKKWNLRAARSMVQRKCKSGGNDYILDLHGLTVKEAETVTKEKLNKWYKKSMTKYNNKPVKPLKIITGLGKHSPNGIAILPPAINRLLDKENWNFSKHKGYVLVKDLKK
ncbi:1967_t:CDS:2 [Diversispora eburnea]|uniref:1967_t:CDS:1 n=1 Tax=Diversispora eburnea TaxID=1213867 RepID=A0A9N9BGZ0_9GLOM|nr:1967_t:CDS:2 [Diversispora eburnea]